MATESLGRETPFEFIKDLRTRFRDEFPNDREKVYTDYSQFIPVISRLLVRYSDDQTISSMNRIQTGLTEVKGIMKDNIDKVLDRGEKIDVLVDKSESLSLTSNSFNVKPPCLSLSPLPHS